MEIDGEAFSPPSLFSLHLSVSSKLPNSASKYDGAIFGHKAFSFSLCLSIWGHFIQQWVPESRAPVATTKDELDGGSWRSYLCALEPELEGKRHKTRGTKIQISLLCAFVSQRKLQRRRSMKYRRSQVTSLLRLYSLQIEFSFSII